MATLKKNLEIIHSGLVKNISLVSAQAHEKARVAAYEYMKHKDDQDKSVIKHDQYESINAVVTWLEKLDAVAKEMPEIQDD
jgi:hypothetical protein